MKKRLKNLLVLAVACGSLAMFTEIVLAQSGCLKWASYGSYDLGSWGDNNRVIRAMQISGSSKIRTNSDWREKAEDKIKSCPFWANAAFTRAAGHWPEQRREIQVHFENAAKKCASYYENQYQQKAGQFCED